MNHFMSCCRKLKPINTERSTFGVAHRCCHVPGLDSRVRVEPGQSKRAGVSAKV